MTANSIENNLLIVDDEPAIGQLISRVAENLGYKVHAVTTADSFLEYQRAQAPTHIAMDLHLPDLDGLALLNRLASEKCSAKILFISEVDREMGEAARLAAQEKSLNVIGAIAKPMLVAELRAFLLSAKNEISWLSAAALGTALELGQLRLVYEPLLDMRSGTITGFEALTRWQHPNHGDVPPADFIPVAESSIFIDRLTSWLVEAGCRQLHDWDLAGLRYDLSLNISSRNLHDDKLADILEGHCAAHGIAPTRITLELTESAAMRDAVLVLNVLKRLRKKGFKLSMDDFGTGYSSLAELLRLPFSEIKIDRIFVHECIDSHDSHAIVRMVIDLGHAMNLSVVAEGIETVEEFNLLRQMGCDMAQGYIVSHPIAATELPELLAHPAFPQIGSTIAQPGT